MLIIPSIHPKCESPHYPTTQRVLILNNSRSILFSLKLSKNIKNIDNILSFLYLAVMLDPSDLNLAAMKTQEPTLARSKQTTNKQRIIVHFSCQEREKKHKQSITSDNSTMICLHAPHHVKESMSTHLSRQHMARFGFRQASHAPP
jgi:hypothetical protein